MTLFWSIWPIDRTLSEWTMERWQRRANLHSPKILHYWNLIIRLFSVITGHSLREIYPSVEMQSVYFTASADRAILSKDGFAIKWTTMITIKQRNQAKPNETYYLPLEVGKVNNSCFFYKDINMKQFCRGFEPDSSTVSPQTLPIYINSYICIRICMRENFSLSWEFNKWRPYAKMLGYNPLRKHSNTRNAFFSCCQSN